MRHTTPISPRHMPPRHAMPHPRCDHFESNPALVACFVQERDVKEGVRMKKEIKSKEKERERKKNIYPRCYSIVIKVRQYYSSIVKKNSIRRSGNEGFRDFDAKYYQHIAFTRPNVNALSIQPITIPTIAIWCELSCTNCKMHTY